MEARDPWAGDRSLVVVLATFLVVWTGWVALPLSVGGLSRADALVMAGSALGFVVLAHVLHRVAGRGRTVRHGPLAGLGPADVREVMRAVRKGEAVAEARLAAPAAAYAGQLVRWQSVSRILLPVIVATSAIDLLVAPPEGAARIAEELVKLVALAALAVTSIVGYRRAKQCEERNLRVPTSLAA